MKAMVLTGIRQMKMVEVPDPEIVNDTDVLIKMERVGVCGSDIHYYTTGKIGSQVVQYPFAVGHEGAGTVIEIGSAVTKVKVGDEIAIEPAMPCWNCDQCNVGRPHTCRNLKFLGCPGQADGCLSEYIVMPETSCFKLADNMILDDGALSEPLAIGVYAVKQSIPMAGAAIGILGFGPIGMSVLLPALAMGAKSVYVTDKIEARLDIARKAGVIYAGNPDNEDVVSEIAALEPNMLDVVFECCGQQEALDNAVDLLKPGGKLMMIGIPEFDNWQFSADKARRKEITFTNVRRQNHALEPTLDMMEKKLFDAHQMVTHRFKFQQTKEAFDLVNQYADGVMKAMIDF
jgi:L-iditol 2-dehydrogenase